MQHNKCNAGIYVFAVM